MDYDQLGAVGDPFSTVSPHGSVNYSEMNKGVTPIFFHAEEPDQKASEVEGRAVFRLEERVKIHVAGDMLNIGTYPVDDAMKERFAVQYRAWKDKQEDLHVIGTPIRQWPLMNRVQHAECESVGIHSVENLSALSDTNVSKIADGRVWREKAKAWLESSKDAGAASRFAAENERLRAEMEAMKKQISDLAARVGDDEDSADEPRPRRGRPPKAA